MTYKTGQNQIVKIRLLRQIKDEFDLLKRNRLIMNYNLTFHKGMNFFELSTLQEEDQQLMDQL